MSAKKYTITRWKATMFGNDRREQYCSRTFGTQDDAVGYIKGWIKEDDSKCAYDGKGIFRVKKLLENRISVHVYRDGEYVGSVAPSYDTRNVHFD